jgi:hypothetical protein
VSTSATGPARSTSQQALSTGPVESAQQCSPSPTCEYAAYRTRNDALVLSTQPLDCSGSSSWEEEVNLLLKNDGTRGRLSGFLVEGVDTDEVSRPAKVKLSAKAGETVAANLDGNFQLGPYAVKLEGKASLLACD